MLLDYVDTGIFWLSVIVVFVSRLRGTKGSSEVTWIKTRLQFDLAKVRMSLPFLSWCFLPVTTICCQYRLKCPKISIKNIKLQFHIRSCTKIHPIFTKKDTETKKNDFCNSMFPQASQIITKTIKLGWKFMPDMTVHGQNSLHSTRWWLLICLLLCVQSFWSSHYAGISEANSLNVSTIRLKTSSDSCWWKSSLFNPVGVYVCLH